MCRRLLCYYEDCKHEEEYGISRCWRERRYPGTCRSEEAPDREEDPGLCESCREKALEELDVRIGVREGFLGRLGVNQYTQRSLELVYPRSSEQTSPQYARMGSKPRDSRSNQDSDEEWTMIERSPWEGYPGKTSSCGTNDIFNAALDRTMVGRSVWEDYPAKSLSCGINGFRNHSFGRTMRERSSINGSSEQSLLQIRRQTSSETSLGRMVEVGLPKSHKFS